MNNWQIQFEEEAKLISDERETYGSHKQDIGAKIFEKLALCFLGVAFLSLPLIFFTEVTLVHSTCLFIISFVLQPSDGDRYESQIKGIAQDLAHIRIHTAITGKAARAKKEI